MDKDSLTYKTFKNISYSVIGYGWPTLFALFITPIIIFNLGVKNYGIYIFVNTIISLLGLLDLGIGLAIIKNLSNYLGKKDNHAIIKLIHTSISLLFIIGSIGLIISTTISFFGSTLLPEQFSYYKQFSSLFLIGGFIFFISSVFAIYSVILTSLQRFDISTKIGIVSTTATSLSILLIATTHGSLQTIFLVQLLINIIIGFVIFYYAKRILPIATFRFGWNINEIKNCYKFGIVASINNIANVSLSSLDRLIIPFFVGPSNLTYYSVPGNATSKIPNLTSILSNTMFPTISELEGSGEKERIANLYIRSFRLITIIASAFTVTAIAFANKTLFYWLNSDFADKSTNIFIILALTSFVLALFGPLSSFLLGLGKLNFLTKMSVSMGVLNIILLFILLPKYGIIGAAWAYLLSMFPVAYLFYYTEKHFLHLEKRTHYYTKKIKSTFITSILVWSIDAFLLSKFVINLPLLLLAGVISVISYVILYKLFGFFEDEDWNDLMLFYRVSKKRFFN